MVQIVVPSTGEDNPTQPDTTGQGTTPTTITRRLTNWFEDLRLSVKRIEERPDHPSGDIVYLVKDVFTTRDGAWDVTSDRYAVPEWAKDSYLAGFSKAHERNNLYAAVLDLDDKFLSGQEILFWTGGIGKLSDLGSTTTARKNAAEQPGWATMMMFGSSAYDPTAGQNGPWCWTPSGLPAEVVCGGGLPANGQNVSTFVVWQAVKNGETPAPKPTPTPTPTPTPVIERRFGSWVAPLNIKIKRIEERPDHVPPGDVVYLLKDIFTTANGSWENQGRYGAIDQWARDTYLKPFGHPEYFDDAGADHHLFAAILDVNGKLIKNADILYWSDGFDKLGDSNYDGYVMGSLGARYPRTKDKSGWANIEMSGGSSYAPDRGESGPWCWTPFGLPAEVICGGGMPLKNHISVFAVWQAVPRSQVVVTPPPVTGDFRIYMPSIMSGGTGASAPAALPSAAPAPISRQSEAAAAPDEAVAEVIRTVAWGRLGLDYRPGATLAEYARRMGLGAPLTTIFEAAGYAAQGYHGGIVLVSLADANAIMHVSW